MPFRSIKADPKELHRLCNAFDNAWIAVNEVRRIDPLQASAERERLGYIITQLWQSDSAANLAAQAAEQFLASFAGTPRLSEEARKHS